MLLFETERLEVRQLNIKDFDYFKELVTAPEIIDPVPVKRWSDAEVEERFENFTNYPVNPNEKETVIWGVFEKGNEELIGLNGYLTNDENQREIAYRFRKPYWGKGYATELAKNMIVFCFETLENQVLTADVFIENIGSVKILEKFFNPVREFYNEKDGCMDRRYILTKEDWINNKK
ncbi:GNAT family N-acetyltransferase [Aureivirga sp. CE67]|uniref:GNAT family N-acetyltransferase n=1 Tax=Aureivirga sp. CE67 TaxID=1788983 RepID=UPI0018CB74EB|nr:GNAT family N-acetyltransferase [Aureivirga sp. CE67]